MSDDESFGMNPGGRVARERGCRCPVLDNGHGRGYLGGVVDADGEVVFVRRLDCPMHGEPAVQE